MDLFAVCRNNKKEAFYFTTTSFIFIIIPSIFLIYNLNPTIVSIILILLNHSLIFITILLSLLICSQYKIFDSIKTILIVFAALYYLMISFFIIYAIFTRHTFDLSFFLDSYQEIIKSGINIFNIKIILLIILFGTLSVFYYVIFLKLLYCAKNIKCQKKIFRNKIWTIFILLLNSFIFVVTNLCIAKQYVVEITEINKARKIILPIFPDNSHYKTDSKENIFILQLESGNALTATGDFTFIEKKYNDIYTPKLREISKDGVFLSDFLGNSIQTNRAQLNILCGLVNNIGKSFSFKPNEIQTDCLPKILKKSGYKTIAFRSDDLEFANTGNFLKNIGFDEIHYNNIMKKNDLKYSWGYDDCIFYQRAFEYLTKSYSDSSKLFVYFEVSAHHFPFENHSRYNFIHKFHPSTNFVEQYLNSSLEQDYCVSQFYNNFKKYNNKKTHLFILPDTSWPIGLHNNFFNEKNAFNDNFLIPLTYIPPSDRKEEFALGKKINKSLFSQTDLIPTIFELLNNTNYQNSFAFALKNGAKNEQMYEHCQILVQPYNGPEIAIIKNFDKFIYRILEKKLIYYNLADDWDEQYPYLIDENMQYQEFKKKYYCKRYLENK